MTNDNPLKLLIGFIALVIAILVLLSFSSCNGCKKPQPPAPTVPEIITAAKKPVEDSLRKEVVKLKTEIDSLKIVAAKASVKKEIIKERIIERPVPVTDSGALIAYNDLKEDFDKYVAASDEQADNQGKIITTQDRIITSQQSDIALQKSKFKELATAYTNLNDQYGQSIKDLNKANKKLHRAKVFNKIFGIGTAAGIGLAAIIFL